MNIGRPRTVEYERLFKDIAKLQKKEEEITYPSSYAEIAKKHGISYSNIKLIRNSYKSEIEEVKKEL